MIFFLKRKINFLEEALCKLFYIFLGDLDRERDRRGDLDFLCLAGDRDRRGDLDRPRLA